MHSMTGCGSGKVQQDGWEVTVDLKTVNHRFLDVSMRLPRHLSFAEDAMRRQIAGELARGHADVFVTYRNARPDARKVVCDTALAAAFGFQIRSAEIDKDRPDSPVAHRGFIFTGRACDFKLSVVRADPHLQYSILGRFRG